MENCEQEQIIFLKEIGLEQYGITNKGKLYSKKSKKFLKLKKLNGYFTIRLVNNTTKLSTTKTISRLVAEYFIPNPYNLPYVDHIDANIENNNVENLQWVTQKQNLEKNDKPIFHKKRILQKKDGIVVKIWDSILEATNNLNIKCTTSISNVLSGYNKTAAGYSWEYEDDNYKKVEVDLSETKKYLDYDNYLIFKDSRIYNIITKKFLKHILTKNDSYYVTLCKNGKKKNIYVHRIIAECFIENPNNYKHVKHINDKLNNNYDNLIWYN